MRLTTNDMRGITLYIALAITSALLLVSFAILNLTIKQISISGITRDSQAAFFAADSGTECALFWDLKNPTNPSISAFSTSTPVQDIVCSGNPITPTREEGTSATSTFFYTFSPDPFCVTVDVVKSYSLGAPKTKIESRGYNTCEAGNLKRVERAILVTY